MTRLTYIERRVMRHHGKPAALIAVLERLRVHEVLEAKQSLARRGVFGITAFAPGPTEPVAEDQLSFDRMMRANRAPRPADVELEHTTTTDPEGW